MQLDAHLGTMTDEALVVAAQQRFDLPYAGRIVRHHVVVGYAIRTTSPGAVTAILWVDEDARIAFIAAADQYQTYTRDSNDERRGDAVPRLADTLAWWAYLDPMLG